MVLLHEQGLQNDAGDASALQSLIDGVTLIISASIFLLATILAANLFTLPAATFPNVQVDYAPEDLRCQFEITKSKLSVPKQITLLGDLKAD